MPYDSRTTLREVLAKAAKALHWGEEEARVAESPQRALEVDCLADAERERLL